MRMQARITNTKVDVAFDNSLQGVKKNMKLQIGLHLLQCVAMVTMIFVDVYVYQHKDGQVLSFFVTASCITFLNLAAKFGHLMCRLNDAPTLMMIATELNHVIDQDVQSQRIGLNQNQNIEYAVSTTIYNAQNAMTIEQAVPTIRNSLEGPLGNMIKSLALSRDPLNRCTISLGSGISFALFVYGIVVLATVPSMQTAQIIVMSLFLVSEFIVQIQIFLCLIFIALLPLLCFIVCIYACCCRQGHKPAQLPAAAPATVQIIQRADGQPCSICFQNIMIDEQVVVLPCSDKHIFHQNCITAWTTVKPTCPMCRRDLSQ